MVVYAIFSLEQSRFSRPVEAGARRKRGKKQISRGYASMSPRTMAICIKHSGRQLSSASYQVARGEKEDPVTMASERLLRQSPRKLALFNGLLRSPGKCKRLRSLLPTALE